MDSHAYNCPCCLENMRQCKMFKCHHVVCKECYELMKTKTQDEYKNFLCPICRNVEFEAPIVEKNSDEENQNIIIIIDDQGSIDYYTINTNNTYNGNRKMLLLCFITLIWALIVMPIIYLYYEENKL